MGAKAEILDDGCCGMAGSFGFEEHKYDLSMKVYDHRLGPRLRSLRPQQVVLADGFSFKTQIEQATGRRPLHLAQLLQKAARAARNGGPESHSSGASPWISIGAPILAGLAIGLGAAHCVRRRMFR